MAFVDAVRTASLHPETFHLPDTSALQPGDAVKISNRLDRFWVVLESTGEKLSGRVDNRLVFASAYDFGDVVDFERHNVLDVSRHPGGEDLSVAYLAVVVYHRPDGAAIDHERHFILEE